MRNWLRAIVVAMLLGAGAWPSAAEPRADSQLVRTLVDAAGQRDWAAAERAAARLGGPPFTTWVTWRRLREGDLADFWSYRDFLARASHWPETVRLQVRAEELLPDGLPPNQTVAFFADRPPRTPKGRLLLAEALLALGDTERGTALLRRSWVEDDHAPADEQRIRERAGSALRREDHHARLARLLWDGSASAARRVFPLVDSRRRAIAEARLALQAGGKTADRAIRQMPSEIAADPGVLYDRIRLERQRGRHAVARGLLLRIDREPERPDAWWAERGYHAREALDNGDAQLAYRLAAGHRLVDGQAFAEAEWLAGWIALRLIAKPSDATLHFERLFERVTTPLSRSRAAYWAGRSAAETGKAAVARSWYERATAWPATFYGQLAAAELGRRSSFGRAPEQPSGNLRRTFGEQELVVLAEAFCGAGASDAASPIIRRLGQDAESDPSRLALVLELALRCGRLDLAASLGRAPVREGRVDPLLAFPVPRLDGFLQPVVPGVSSALLLAVARQESQFDPRAVSPAGARGLMQLMPATARLVARELDTGFDLAALLDEPDYNLRLGTHYLARQLERFGEPALALAAYNAGPGRVESWLARYGDPRGRGRHALVDWIERIPFRETRNYVQRVLEAAEVYAYLLAERSPPTRPLAVRDTAALFDRPAGG